MKERAAVVFLVRHGETSWNAEGRLQGRTDIAMNLAGVQQARQVGAALKEFAAADDEEWVGLYSSPLERALKTAEAIGASIGLTPIVREDLVERSFGALEGRTRSEIRAAFPRWREEPDLVPGLEGQQALADRAMRAMEAIASSHRGQRVVVVSHGAWINAFLHAASSGAVGSGKTRLANGGYSIVKRVDDGWRVLEVDITRHLH